MGTTSPRPMLLLMALGAMCHNTSHPQPCSVRSSKSSTTRPSPSSRLNHRLDDICRREDVLTKAEAKLKADHAGFNHNLADELYRRVTDLEVRLAQLESKRAHDPDDDELPSPPGDPGALPLHDPNPPPGTPDVAQMLPDGISDEVETDTRGQFLRIPVGKLRMHDGEEFPDPELPHPPVQQQPIAAGLDDGD